MAVTKPQFSPESDKGAKSERQQYFPDFKVMSFYVLSKKNGFSLISFVFDQINQFRVQNCYYASVVLFT